jgi:hypothetical protein
MPPATFAVRESSIGDASRFIVNMLQMTPLASGEPVAGPSIPAERRPDRGVARVTSFAVVLRIREAGRRRSCSDPPPGRVQASVANGSCWRWPWRHR